MSIAKMLASAFEQICDDDDAVSGSDALLILDMFNRHTPTSLRNKIDSMERVSHKQLESFYNETTEVELGVEADVRVVLDHLSQPNVKQEPRIAPSRVLQSLKPTNNQSNPNPSPNPTPVNNQIINDKATNSTSTSNQSINKQTENNQSTHSPSATDLQVLHELGLLDLESGLDHRQQRSLIDHRLQTQPVSTQQVLSFLEGLNDQVELSHEQLTQLVQLMAQDGENIEHTNTFSSRLLEQHLHFTKELIPPPPEKSSHTKTTAKSHHHHCHRVQAVKKSTK